jgi:hypothetical protein
MEVVTTDDNSTRHLRGDNTPCEDATADGNLTGKWTFFVYIPRIVVVHGLFEESKKAHAPI